MQLTEDSFHALARSSPWRWTTLHFRHRSGAGSRIDQVEAWLVRPDGVRVVDARGQPIGNSLESQRADGRPTGEWSPPEPTYRPDGLVAKRPSANWSEDAALGDGLFWNNYFWVAMLDPVELSHDVQASVLREGEVAGRAAWWAQLVAEPGYDPRCGGNCCELLYSEAGLMADYHDPSEVPADLRGRTYPDAYEVALDVATGVVVRLHPVGGDADAPWLENDILSSG